MKVKICSDFPVDSSFPGDRASLHFEERSGDTSNFPKTLHNFSTSSARWHQNIMPENILTCWFYLQKFHSLFKPSAIFDHERYFFDLLTINTTIRCTPMEVLMRTSDWWFQYFREKFWSIFISLTPQITSSFYVCFANIQSYRSLQSRLGNVYRVFLGYF